MTNHCRACQQPNRTGARFCSRCQAPLDFRLCGTCGHSNRQEAKHCGQCGTFLQQSCSQCQQLNRSQARRCRHCGSQLLVPCPHCQTSNRQGARYCRGCAANLQLPGKPQKMADTGKLSSGELLNGRYVPTRKLAQGGQGAVYQVTDTQNGGVTYALKEMSLTALEPEERVDAVRDFHREADLLMSLEHPNLVKVVERFSQQGKEYLVMEHIEGETLEEVSSKEMVPEDEKSHDSGTLPEVQVLEMAEQLCDVLAYLHEQSPPIIYRDLKPANVMIEQGSGRVKLIDFGIVRFHKPGQSKDTKLLGTPGFAPPEQYGKGQTDARSDIFALGVMLHVLLTGYDVSQNPWTYPPVRSLGVEVSKPLEDLIIKATHLDADKRFQNASAMTRALQRCQPKGSQSLVERFTSRFTSMPAENKPSPPSVEPVTVEPVVGTPASAPLPPSSSKPAPLRVRPVSLAIQATHGKIATEQLVIVSQNGQPVKGEVEATESWLHLDRVRFDGDIETVGIEIDTKGAELPRVRHPRPPLFARAWNWAERKGASRRPWSETNCWGPTLKYGLPALIGGSIGQIFIWLVYFHADYFVSGKEMLSGDIAVRYAGGQEQIPVQVEIGLNRVQRMLGWAGSVLAVMVELSVMVWLSIVLLANLI